MARRNQIKIDDDKRTFLIELGELLRKYDAKIIGGGIGFETEEGYIDIRFKDGSEINYSQEKPSFGTECVLDASSIFDFD